MKNIVAKRAEGLLHKLIAEGEHERQDFKYTVNDPRKIARSVSAFANNSGGRLLIGVDDNGIIKGVRNEEDVYVVEAAAGIYCIPPCEVQFSAYKDKSGISVIRADIQKSVLRPVYVKEENNIRQAYYRVADENILAHPLMIRVWENMKNSDRNNVFNMTTDNATIISLLEKQPMTPEELYRSVTISKSRVENIITDLIEMGLIDFKFINRQFHLNAIKL